MHKKNVLTYHAESDSALLNIKKRTKKETCPKMALSMLHVSLKK